MMNIPRQLAEDFWEENSDHVNSKEFIPKAREAAHEIDAKGDQIVFLTDIMAKVSAALEGHGACGNSHCTVEPSHQKAIYFLRQELSRLDVVVDQDPFSSTERDIILERLEQILNELAQIKEGQGIVAQDVEGLQDLMYLGKQKWHRQFVGTVSDWVGAGMVSEAVAKPMLSAMQTAFDQLPGLLGA
jgi:hypothetical protein